MATIDEVMAEGWRAFQAGDLDRAESAYRSALAGPDDGPGLVHAGATWQMRGRPELAAARYREAIRLEPEHAEALNNLGVALHAIRRGEEAVDVLRRAVAIAAGLCRGPQQPGQRPARSGRASMRPNRATDGPWTSGPTMPRPSTTSATPSSRGGPAGALACYDRAWTSGPTWPRSTSAARWPWLEAGDFERGWPEYEWRLKCPQSGHPALPPAPLGRRPARRADDPALRRPRARRRDPVHPLCPDGQGPGRPGRRGLPRTGRPAAGDLPRRGPGRRRGLRRSRRSTSMPR